MLFQLLVIDNVVDPAVRTFNGYDGTSYKSGIRSLLHLSAGKKYFCKKLVLLDALSSSLPSP